ncbi:hypothetical protein Cgig2_011263 [Carnegiea gigantea]|uniref:F-box protein n=1 Tax=Carnegiea gigantea TaxID=171969 RepID=A0A9Q1KF21_9CARY|nr:hypothetical protein Cgig2_011263 [Carnegiea gigantea]
MYYSNIPADKDDALVISRIQNFLISCFNVQTTNNTTQLIRGAANAVLISNCLHWTGPYQRSVLSFDLHDEQFHEVPLPNYDHVDKKWHIQQGVLDGFLCVTFSITSFSVPHECSFDALDYEGICGRGILDKTAIPLANIKGQCVVLFSKGYNEGLFLWNTEKKTMREIEEPVVHYSQVTVCLDTLAPP